MNNPGSGAEEKWEDVFVVAGPTASGKSQLAVDLAEKWGAEIISADAYQVYRGLSMLTAQPSAEQQLRVRHHLVNVLDPTEEFSPADFASLAREAMEEIRARNKRVIIVGGSGFYLEALLDGLPETPPPDAVIRLRLSQMSLDEMVLELGKHDPAAAAVVDQRNPRRVQRALEICLATGRPFTSFAKAPQSLVRGVILKLPSDLLQKRIEDRVTAMLKAGAIDEVRQLGPCSSTCQKAIGLREVTEFLKGEISLSQCHEKIVIATRQYAKRQRTWFRNRVRWDSMTSEAALDYVSSPGNFPNV